VTHTMGRQTDTPEAVLARPRTTRVRLVFGLLSGALLCALCLPHVLHCQVGSATAPGLTATPDRTSVRLGETVVLTLAYRLPEGSRLPDTLEIGGLEGLTIVEQKRDPGGIRIKVLVDRLDPWQTESLSMTYLDKDGNRQTLETGPVSVSVLSNLGDKTEEAQLRPIQGIIPVASPWLRYMPWAAVFLGVLLAIGVFLWRRKRAIGELRAEIVEPAHIRARKELERLNTDGLFEQGQVKSFYFRFSEILRWYLEAVRGFPAPELTTEEIAGRIHYEDDRTVMSLLRTADLVKFADAVPTGPRKDEEIRIAFSYIERTSSPADGFGSPSELSGQSKQRGRTS
jgi:hypothetical protein